MTGMIPQPLYGPVEGHLDSFQRPEAPTAVEASPRCVSCALEGTSRPLAAYFLVSGTSYCETHAVRVVHGAT